MSLAVPPKVSVLLAEDDEGFAASHKILSQRTKQGQSEFLLGGYATVDTRTSAELAGNAVAYCDRSIETYATKAFQTVRSLIEGKPVGDRVEVPVVFHHATILYVPTTRPLNGDPVPPKKKPLGTILGPSK
jgi:hypothetical protein